MDNLKVRKCIISAYIVHCKSGENYRLCLNTLTLFLNHFIKYFIKYVQYVEQEMQLYSE